MEKLPNEVLHKIFIRVPFKERLECMLVCRHWYNTLLGRSLLHDVEFNSEERLNQFVDLMQQMPDRGNQVEILDINFLPDGPFHYLRFCNSLPNLCKIRITSGSRWGSKERYWSEQTELETIDSKIDEIADLADCELARQLIMSNSCTRLTSLKLLLSEIESPREEIFVYLKNTPALKKLVLSGNYTIRIEECELLHKNAPTLETLCLEGTFLDAEELPRDILPATSVKSLVLHCELDMDSNTYPNWYKYWAKKYTNLMDFDFLESRIGFVDSDLAMTIYRDGLLPIYKNTRNQQQKTFNAINIPTELDIFNQLDEFSIRFETFNFDNNENRPIFTQLAESNLSMYAKHITLVSTIIPSPFLLQNFTSLKTLEIDHNDGSYMEVNLTEYLNAIPSTLTSFSAKFVDAEISELPIHSNNVEVLFLCCNTITPKLCKVISSYFPGLNDLYLSGHVSENININLPDNHFKKLSIHTYFDGDLPHGFLITNAESLEPQYFAGEEPRNDYSYLTSVSTAEDIQNRVNINLTYATAEETTYYTSFMD